MLDVDLNILYQTSNVSNCIKIHQKYPRNLADNMRTLLYLFITVNMGNFYCSHGNYRCQRLVTKVTRALPLPHRCAGFRLLQEVLCCQGVQQDCFAEITNHNSASECQIVRISSFTSRIFKWAVIETLVTFHYTGWLMGIIITACHNPYVTG